MKNIQSSLVCLILIGLAANASATQTEKIGPKLLEILQSPIISNSIGNNDLNIPIIVEFSKKVNLLKIQGVINSKRRQNILEDLKTTNERSENILQPLLSSFDIQRIESLWLINGFSFKASPLLIDLLTEIPQIAQIRLDFQIKLSVEPSTGQGESTEAEWNLTQIGAPDLWKRGITGQQVVVANMDTGVDINHSELFSRWRAGDNSWYDPHCQPAPWENPALFVPAPNCPPDTNYSVPRDRAGNIGGHGTGTMGIMVAGDAGGSAVGVAPNAQWIAVKMFDEDNEATMTAIHKSFQWLLDPDGNSATDDAPDIVNSSWVIENPNNDGCILEFQSDLQTLKAAGIAVVFAAGNVGINGNPSTSRSPSNNPAGYAVGAVDINEQIAGFSSRGPGPSATDCQAGFYPELVAPGVSVRTTSKGSIPDNIDFYQTVSGTSFSAPHVAGAMALLLQAFPDTTVEELENAMLESARQTSHTDDSPGPDNSYGHGLLDAREAYFTVCLSNDTDSDNDGIADICDNCTLVENTDQSESDGDVYGDACDADFNNEGNIVDLSDFSVFLGLLGTAGPLGDFNRSTSPGVDLGDHSILLGMIGKAPGPSGLAPSE
ncbi:MAG: S8 family serine peptidase [Methylococcales bacterium]